MIENLRTASPVEIDTELAEIDLKLFRANQTLAGATDTVAAYERYSAKDEWNATRYAPALAEARAKAEKATAAVAALHAEAAPLHDEYDRRPWDRTWMVLNTGGHAHRGTGYASQPHCSTCFPTTRYGWLPQLAGATEDEIVAALGESACTTCYTSAPATPRTVFTLEEQEQQAERDAKAAAKADRAAAKAAKAITNPDGTPLHLNGYYGVVNTEVTATIEYVKQGAYLAACNNGFAHTGRLNEATTDVMLIVAALAAKHGTTVEEQAERLAPKVAARLRKDYPDYTGK
jgi:NTP pyrophosphatase (non-canonical NTP hydrolase)